MSRSTCAVVHRIGDRAELGLVAHHGAQRDKGRMNARDGAEAFENNGLRIVDQPQGVAGVVRARSPIKELFS